MLIERGIQILDVGGMMHVVVQVHRLLINGGFERRIGIRQRGKFVRHFCFLHSLCHFLSSKIPSFKDDGV